MERTLSATVPLLPPVAYSSPSTSSSLANYKKELISFWLKRELYILSFSPMD